MTRKQHGFTLIEVLMMTAIIALLLVTTAVYVLPSLNRGKDGRRKADLHRMFQLLEEHYNDKGYYPPLTAMNTCGSDSTNPLTPYQATVPCEPQTDLPYYYVGEDCNPTRCLRYRLLTTLEYRQDPDIEKVSCSPTAGCGGLGRDGNALPAKYNYGVAAGMTVKQ